MQEFESRVLMHDLLAHGDQSVVEAHVQGPNGEIPERHWFAIVRRYVRVPFLLHAEFLDGSPSRRRGWS